MPARWSDSFLDAMRKEGDPTADLVVRSLYDQRALDAVDSLFRKLVLNEQVVPRALPPVVRGFFEAEACLPDWADRAQILVGQSLFARHAPCVIAILFCGSLPITYAARRGVQVIDRTGRLYYGPRRRALETAQFVIDVMTPGGLDARGAGIRSAQKVRLMHGAVRHLLLLSPKEKWNFKELGMPINQEDLAGVLMSFSVAVIEGLGKFGIDIEAKEREAYLHLWKVVGHVLGLRDDLLPSSYAEAQDLAGHIKRRHFEASPEGQKLTEALLAMLREAIPGRHLDGLPAAAVRHLVGEEVADLLRVPDADLERDLLRVVAVGGSILASAVDRSQALREAAEHFGQLLLRALLHMERGPRRVPFRIPRSLAESLRPPRATSLKGQTVLGLLAGLVGDATSKLRIVSRRVALSAPYEWLQFATRFRSDDGTVGEAFFKEFAERVDARFLGKGTDTGLMSDFDELRSDDFEPYSVAPIIREFYEHTTRFDLELEVKWSPLFQPIGFVYREWVARRIHSFDFPIGAVKDLENWIELIDIERDGKIDVRAWVRVHGDERRPMWVGAYKVYRSTIDGKRAAYVSVAFPIPGGNLTTVLSPRNLDGDGLLLTTRDTSSSEAGLYQIIPGERTFAMLPAYGLGERFEIRPTADGSEIRVRHRSSWLGLTMFQMHYSIRHKRARTRAHVNDFCTAIRAPRPKGGRAASPGTRPPPRRGAGTPR